MFKLFLLCFFIVFFNSFAINSPFAPPDYDVSVKEITDLDHAQIGDKVQTIDLKTKNKDVKIKTFNSKLPSLEAKIHNWYIMSTEINNRNVCYMIKYPDDKVGNHKETRKPYMMIAFINMRRYEISISSGYKYRNNSTLNLNIDGLVFKLSANNNIAWSRGVFDDVAIIKTMTTSFRATVSAESSVGTYSVDTYDLVGFKIAYDKMISVCKKNIKK